MMRWRDVAICLALSLLVMGVGMLGTFVIGYSKGEGDGYQGATKAVELRSEKDTLWYNGRRYQRVRD